MHRARRLPPNRHRRDQEAAVQAVGLLAGLRGPVQQQDRLFMWARRFITVEGQRDPHVRVGVHVAVAAKQGVVGTCGLRLFPERP